MRTLPDLSVYVVLDTGLCRPEALVATAAAAVAGGARVLQLRDKAGPTQRRVATGRALQAALGGTGAALILNDDLDAARAIGADGLHVGQGDLDPTAARATLGANAILGLSVETVAHACAVDEAVVDYVGAGPVFATATKPDHAPPLGWDGLQRVLAAAPVPGVAIGGIKASHAGDVRRAGAVGMAVVSAVCGQPDPAAAARALRAAWEAAA